MIGAVISASVAAYEQWVGRCYTHLSTGGVRRADARVLQGDITRWGSDVTRAVMIFAIGFSAACVSFVHAEPTGTIHFSGLIVQETCAATLAMTRSLEPQQARDRCMQGAVGVGGADDVPTYTEHVAAVHGYSGIDLLDYYVDIARSRPGTQVQLITRDYS